MFQGERLGLLLGLRYEIFLSFSWSGFLNRVFSRIVSSGLNRAMLAIILTTQLVRPTGVF
jgi:hypothetical protein